MLSPSSRALLRAVAAALVDSGEAEHPRKHRRRADTMQRIAADPRINSSNRQTQSALIDDVCAALRVTRNNARVIVFRARRTGAAGGGRKHDAR